MCRSKTTAIGTGAHSCAHSVEIGRATAQSCAFSGGPCAVWSPSCWFRTHEYGVAVGLVPAGREGQRMN